MWKFPYHVVFQLFIPDFIYNYVCQLSIFSLPLYFLNLCQFLLDFGLGIHSLSLDIRSCPRTPSHNLFILRLDVLFKIELLVVLELSKILQNRLILSFSVVKNISVHLKELLIEFEINSLRLILIFQVLEVEAFCKFFDIISQQNGLLNVFLDEFLLIQGILLNKFRTLWLICPVYFPWQLLLVIIIGAFLFFVLIIVLLLLVTIYDHLLRILILELVD